MTEDQTREAREALQDLFPGAGAPTEGTTDRATLALPGGSTLVLRPLERGGWKSSLQDKNQTPLIKPYWGSTARICLTAVKNEMTTLKKATLVL